MRARVCLCVRVKERGREREWGIGKLFQLTEGIRDSLLSSGLFIVYT